MKPSSPLDLSISATDTSIHPQIALTTCFPSYHTYNKTNMLLILPSKFAHPQVKVQCSLSYCLPQSAPLRALEQRPLYQGSSCLLSHSPPVPLPRCCLKVLIRAGVTIYHSYLKSFLYSVWPINKL